MRIVLDNLQFIMPYIDEDTIVDVFNLSHRQFRKNYNKLTPLTNGCLSEIRHCATSLNIDDISRVYKCSLVDARSALYGKTHKPMRPSARTINLALIRYDDVEKVRRLLHVDYNYMKQVLKDIGWRLTTRNKDAAMLLDRTNLSYVAIAKLCGLSKGTVSATAADMGISRQKQGILPWPEIVAYAEKHGVSKAARDFECTRSNIYYHKNRLANA